MAKLNNYTGQDYDNLFDQDSDYVSLSDTQKLSILNLAREKVVDFFNSIGSNLFRFDCFSDADNVLAPTGSALANLYEDYIQLKFSGGVGTEVAATKINLSLVSASYSAASGLAVYTVELDKSGADAIDGDTQILPGVSGEASIEKVSGDIFTVTAAIGHDDFSVFVINMKES